MHRYNVFFKKNNNIDFQSVLIAWKEDNVCLLSFYSLKTLLYNTQEKQFQMGIVKIQALQDIKARNKEFEQDSSTTELGMLT